MSNNEIIPIKCELYWAHLSRPDRLSNKYSVKLCNLSDKAVAKLKEMGLKPKRNMDEHPEYGWHLNAKSQFPITAHFEDGTECTDLIGNGTGAVAKVGVREFQYEGLNGKTAALKKLTITDFVPAQPRIVETETEQEPF